MSGVDGHRVVVLLVDDQVLITEAVRRMVAGEPDVDFHSCSDPAEAIGRALAIRPTVILLDLVMPGIDGMTLLGSIRREPALADVPVVMLSAREEPQTKADAFAAGANDYLVKLPARVELLARARLHSRGYIHRLERDEAYRKLEESRRALAEDVNQAAIYVESLLPPKLRDGAIRTDWRFEPSASLGGDSFGYHWLDDRHFAFYLLDVVGHGVGAALLSVSVLNALRSRSLPDIDFRRPDDVLNALNRTFQMTSHADKYFTAWYGVFDIDARTICYAGGGHPPALLTRDAPGTRDLLGSSGPMVGAFESLTYSSLTADAPPGSCLYLYSDGLFEVATAEGPRWPYQRFLDVLDDRQGADPDGGRLDHVLRRVRTIMGDAEFDDDVSILELHF